MSGAGCVNKATAPDGGGRGCRQLSGIGGECRTRPVYGRWCSAHRRGRSLAIAFLAVAQGGQEPLFAKSSEYGKLGILKGPSSPSRR